VSWPRPVAGHVWQFGLVTAVPGAAARMTGRCPFRPPWPGKGTRQRRTNPRRTPRSSPEWS